MITKPIPSFGMRPLRQKRLVSFLALSIIIAACSKESDPDPVLALRLTKKATARYRSPGPSQTVDSAQSLTYQNRFYAFVGQVEAVYQYDAQQRLVRQEVVEPGVSSAVGAYVAVSYAYPDNKMLYTNLRMTPLLPHTYQLNPQGYVMDYNTYDSEGYLVRRQQIPGAVTTQTIRGGDIVKKVYQDNIGRSTITYEYDRTKSGLPDPETVLWGRASRHLLLKTTEVTESFTGVVNNLFPDHIVTTYQYEFDAQGLVKQQYALVEDSYVADPRIVSRVLLVNSLEFAR